MLQRARVGGWEIALIRSFTRVVIIHVQLFANVCLLLSLLPTVVVVVDWKISSNSADFPARRSTWSWFGEIELSYDIESIANIALAAMQNHHNRIWDVKKVTKITSDDNGGLRWEISDEFSPFLCDLRPWEASRQLWELILHNCSTMR